MSWVNVRPFRGCKGRLFPLKTFSSAAICWAETWTGVVMTSQLTPSVHGGAVSEPS